jgi:uncharacterized protein GlcG (DUF336 family)
MRIGLLVPLALLAASAGAQDHPLTFDEALAIGQSAVAAARAKGQPASVAVANREGRVLVALRMDGTSFVNLEVAQQKAATAALLGAPTMVVQQAVDAGKASFLSVPGISAIGGGMPVMRTGQVVGGVGISGGSADDDEALARVAVGKNPPLAVQ